MGGSLRQRPARCMCLPPPEFHPRSLGMHKRYVQYFVQSLECRLYINVPDDRTSWVVVGDYWLGQRAGKQRSGSRQKPNFHFLVLALLHSPHSLATSIVGRSSLILQSVAQLGPKHNPNISFPVPCTPCFRFIPSPSGVEKHDAPSKPPLQTPWGEHTRDPNYSSATAAGSRYRRGGLIGLEPWVIRQPKCRTDMHAGFRYIEGGLTPVIP